MTRPSVPAAVAEVHTLRYWRTQQLLTCIGLSRVAGVSTVTIYDIEGGKKTRFRLGTISLLCDALGVTWQQVTEFAATMEERS